MCISKEGIIKLDGEDITGKKTIDINKAGIARTFQNIRLFKQLSVLDNVKVGLHNHYKYSTLEGILRLPKYKKVEKAMDEKAMEILKVFDLDGEADVLATNLPYGKQRKPGDCPCYGNRAEASSSGRACRRYEPE